MSVVNKMLQDLETRQTQEKPPTADYVPPKNSISLSRIVIIVLVLASIAFAAYWWFFEKQKVSSDDAPKAPVYVSAPAERKTQDSRAVAAREDVDKYVSTEGSQMKNIAETSETQALKSQTSTPETLKPGAPTPEALTTSKPSHLEQGDKVISQSHLTQESRLPEETESQSPLNLDGHSTPTSTMEVTTSKQPNSKEALKQRIQVALQLQNNNDAISLLNKLLSIEPDNQPARKKLAALQFAKGNINEAKKVIQTGINRQPEVSDYRLMLARLYVQQKNTDLAHKTLMGALSNASSEPDLISYRASLAKKIERYDLAKEDYTKLIVSQPSNAKWWLGLAISDEKLGNYKAAVLAYRKADELDQLSSEVTTFVRQRLEYLAGVL